MRARAAATAAQPPVELPATPTADQARQRWAALIKRVYQTDPLRCPLIVGAR